MTRRLRFGVALAMASCAVAASAGRLPRYGGELRVQLASVPADLDPLRLRGDDGALVAALMYEGLARLAGNDVEPGLATRWVRDDDGQRWLFVLRNDVAFHDGARCDAEAVKDALQRLADPRQSPAAWLLSGLRGWDDFVAGRTQEIEGLYVLEPDQLEMQFATPVSDLPARLALPVASIARHRGEEWSGTGAFRFESSGPGILRLVPYREHAGGRPYLDRVELATSASGAPALEAGVADLRRVLGIDAQPAGTARWRSPAERLGLALVRPGSRVLSADVRDKLAAGFDREVFVRAVLGGDGRETRDVMPLGPKVVGARNAEPPGDLAARPQERARVVVAEGEPVLRALGERLQVHLFALGVNADLAVLAPAEYAAAIAARAFDVAVLGWTPPQSRGMPLDGAAIPRLLVQSALQPVLGDSLPEAWSALRRTRDLRDAQAALLRDDSCIPLVFFHDTWQTSADVSNLVLGAALVDLGLADAHLEAKSP